MLELGGWKTASFLIASESSVRHWGPLPPGPACLKRRLAVWAACSGLGPSFRANLGNHPYTFFVYILLSSMKKTKSRHLRFPRPNDISTAKWFSRPPTLCEFHGFHGFHVSRPPRLCECLNFHGFTVFTFFTGFTDAHIFTICEKFGTF